ncbi:hypothetical protein HOI83_04085 [Candidatus Uhrbacteria bacterium]|jgi:hypothetical protein|nr:hypothetical protein [Candidatus Uhrbacteria bacterium]
MNEVLTLDEAVTSGKIFALEQHPSALMPPVEVVTALRRSKIAFTWQLITSSRRQITAQGITHAMWPTMRADLRAVDLELETTLDPLLYFMLCFGHYKMDDWDLDRAICAAVEYVQTDEVSERTRELVMFHRDAYAKRIAAHRRSMAGVMAWASGEDEFGLATYHSMGIGAFGG